MSENRTFDQKNGIIGTSVALILLVAIGPHLAKVSSGTDSSGAVVSKTWHPSIDDVLNKKSSTEPATPTVGGMATAMNNNIAALLTKPAIAEAPPNDKELDRLAESARRFYWGYLNGDVSVMENESSFDFGNELSSLKLPESTNVDLKNIKIVERGLDSDKVMVELRFNDGKPVIVGLTKDINWEVTSFEPGS